MRVVALEFSVVVECRRLREVNGLICKGLCKVVHGTCRTDTICFKRRGGTHARNVVHRPTLARTQGFTGNYQVAIPMRPHRYYRKAAAIGRVPRTTDADWFCSSALKLDERGWVVTVDGYDGRTLRRGAETSLQVSVPGLPRLEQAWYHHR